VEKDDSRQMLSSVRNLSAAVVEARTLINAFIADFSVITVLVKAITLSGWVFHMKVLFVSRLI
jgi:hypothetical protein